MVLYALGNKKIRQQNKQYIIHRPDNHSNRNDIHLTIRLNRITASWISISSFVKLCICIVSASHDKSVWQGASSAHADQKMSNQIPNWFVIGERGLRRLKNASIQVRLFGATTKYSHDLLYLWLSLVRGTASSVPKKSFTYAVYVLCERQ